MEMRFRVGTRTVDLAVSDRDGRTVVNVDGRDVIVDDVAFDERSATVVIGGKRHRVLFDVERGHVFAAHGGQAGDVVEADGALLLLEAMKMEMTVRATHRCRVVTVRVEAAAMVGPGDTLVELEEAPEEAQS